MVEEWLVVEHGPGACDQRLELAAAGVQVGQLLLGFCQCRLDGGAGFFEDLDEAEFAILRHCGGQLWPRRWTVCRS